MIMARPKHTKPDKNQKEIVEELRALGYDVDIICNLPGLLIWWCVLAQDVYGLRSSSQVRHLLIVNIKYYKEQKNPRHLFGSILHSRYTIVVCAAIQRQV